MDVLCEIFTNHATSVYIAVGAILLTAAYYCFQNRSLPPGPTGLPYFGFYPFWNDKTPHLHLQELGKKYGDVFSFTVTGRLYINLGSLKALREAHVTKSDCFSDRNQSYNMLNMCFREGISFINGEKWKVLRKFFSQQFRESGFNTLRNEEGSAYETVKGTIEDLCKTEGEPVDLIDLLTDKCTKIMYTILFGERGITVQEIREINDVYGQLFESVNSKWLLLSGNFVRILIQPFLPKYWKNRKCIIFMSKKLYDIIDRHKETFDEGNIRNIIDAYINEGRIRLSKGDPTAQYFTDRALMPSLLQFIGDGVISVAASIASYIQALVDHPEEQEKIFRELIEVIGPDRDPRLEDKSKLPYTNAFISEVSRMNDFLPFFSDMVCKRETYVKDYRIPEGAITVMNLWSINRDPNEYEDPDLFNPSRFIAEEGKRKVEQPIIFGIGKRACIGEGFVMSQVFLFLTTMVKNFHLFKPKNAEDGMVYFGTTIKVCVKPRSEPKSSN